MPHKYHARRTTIDGVTFDSRAEARRYQELKLMQNAGYISDLELQPAFELQPPFTDADGRRQRAIRYVGDFRYIEAARVVVEDVKGYETRVWRLKKKLFLYQYPEIELRVIK